jgi:hypothetical protein
LELTDDIEARLEYFQELDRATRMLNHPGESLVLQSEFLYMVERVDICIDYLREHVCFALSHLQLPGVSHLSYSAIIEKQRCTYSGSSNASRGL